MLLENVFIPDDAEVLPPGLFGAMYNAFPHLFLSFSATFLGLMQAAYGGALAYMTGPMSGAPIPHTEVATKGHAIADMLFAIESDRALYYRAISEGAKMMQLRAPASLARLWRDERKSAKPASCSHQSTLGSPQA
jgi:alkylation response protein AidB-like acyl-CoA dehydrogenase